MQIRIKRVAAALVMGVSALAMSACGEQSGDLSKPASKEWPINGGDWGNTRFSLLNKINKENVKTLGAAWQAKLEGGPAKGTSIVANGKMFTATNQNAYALNPKTGEVIWNVKLPASTYGLFKGVAQGEGMVFVGLGNSHIVALKQDTGETVWEGVIGDGEVGDKEAKRGQFIAGGPTYANGVVMAGLANGDYGIRGRVTGLDAKTGKKLWTFYTIPGPGEANHDTWDPSNEEWKQGGGGVWSMPAIDPELGLVYFGVGNPVPQYGGELRGGDNLYTGSVVALDIKTGERKWHYQVVHHDIWEADLGTPMVLYDAAVDGKTRKAVAAISTNGYIYMLDRATGEPVFPIEERPVPQNELQRTAPTQPFPVGADQVGNRCVDPNTIPEGFKALCMYDPINYDLPNAMYPILSTRAAPMAYNPQTKRFYATAANWPSWIKRAKDPKFFAAGPTVPGMKYTGIHAAMDAGTNKAVWKKEGLQYSVQQNGSGFTATAGGLLFRGNAHGFAEAYDENTGELLWQFQTGANANNSVSTYEVDGEQYVAINSGPSVWAFKLGGTVPQAEPPAQTPAGETTFGGRIVEATEVVLAPTVKDTGLEFVREAKDEYAMAPMRIKVKVGAKVTFRNDGAESHAADALDGSWSTGIIAPGKTATVTFSKAGSYTYRCSEHLWSLGQVVVEE